MQSALNNYWLFKVLLLDTGYLWDVFVDVRALFLWRLFSGNSISIHQHPISKPYFIQAKRVCPIKWQTNKYRGFSLRGYIEVFLCYYVFHVVRCRDIITHVHSGTCKHRFFISYLSNRFIFLSFLFVFQDFNDPTQ